MRKTKKDEAGQLQDETDPMAEASIRVPERPFPSKGWTMMDDLKVKVSIN